MATKNEYAANYIGLNGTIFRGQSNSEWNLMPSAFRVDSLKDFAPQIGGGPPEKAANLPGWLGYTLHSELRALYLFLETADKLGIPTPIDYRNTEEHTEVINALLSKQESEGFNTPFPSQASLNELALAQHHGVPTRLLDWTESPYIASFFAAYSTSPLIDEQFREKSDCIAVFMLGVGHKRHKFQKELIILNSPRHGNNFLRAQKGLFTHMPNANTYLLKNKSWPSFDDIILKIPELTLTKVTLPSSKSNDLLKALFDMDITRHSLMPSLENAAKACSYTLKIFRR